MVKTIVKNPMILLEVSHSVSKEEEYESVITDLIDTAKHYEQTCVGLAAIQIGITKRIIVVRINDKFVPFINPVIIKHEGKKYIGSEGCMSLDGVREVERFERVTVLHKLNGKFVKQHFKGLQAQIIQHEVDHLDGKLI